jgi:hypothetical protein
MTVPTVIATFHLLEWNGSLRMMRALVGDRFRYRGQGGLVFLRVLGTGRGASTAPGAQWGRTAMFCLFDDESLADTFIADVARRRGLVESWHVKMRGAGGHGAWRGRAIPEMMRDAESDGAASKVPVAMITRADVRPGAWRTFARAARIVDRELQATEGLLAVVGIGEAPVFRLGTFSLWRDADAMSAFARRGPRHQQVVARTRSEGWYGEEMFARFTPYWSSGSWDGRDPLRPEPS